MDHRQMTDHPLPDGMTRLSPTSLRLLRQYVLGIAAVLERELGDTLTTSEMRKWFKQYGPTPIDAKAQLEQKERSG